MYASKHQNIDNKDDIWQWLPLNTQGLNLLTSHIQIKLIDILLIVDCN